MTGHRPFSELLDKFTPQRKARTADKLRALKELDDSIGRQGKPTNSPTEPRKRRGRSRG